MDTADLKAVNEVLAAAGALRINPRVPFLASTEAPTNAGLALALRSLSQLSCPISQARIAKLAGVIRLNWTNRLNISAMPVNVALAITALLQCSNEKHTLAVEIMHGWATQCVNNSTETPDELDAINVWRSVLPFANFSTNALRMAVPVILRPYYFEVNASGFKSAEPRPGRTRVQPHKRWSSTLLCGDSKKYSKRAYPPQSTHADLIYCGIYEQALTFRAVCHLQMAVLMHSFIRREAVVVANMIIMDLWKSHQHVAVGVWPQTPADMWVAATAICFALGNSALPHDHNFGSHGYFSTTDPTAHPYSSETNTIGATFAAVGIAGTTSAEGMKAVTYMEACCGLLVPNLCQIITLCLTKKGHYLPSELILYIARHSAPTQPTDTKTLMRLLLPAKLGKPHCPN